MSARKASKSRPRRKPTARRGTRRRTHHPHRFRRSRRSRAGCRRRGGRRTGDPGDGRDARASSGAAVAAGTVRPRAGGTATGIARFAMDTAESAAGEPILPVALSVPRIDPAPGERG